MTLAAVSRELNQVLCRFLGFQMVPLEIADSPHFPHVNPVVKTKAVSFGNHRKVLCVKQRKVSRGSVTYRRKIRVVLLFGIEKVEKYQKKRLSSYFFPCW